VDNLSIIIITFTVVIFLYLLYKGLKSVYQDFKNIYYFKIKNYFIEKKQEQYSEKKKIIGIGGGGSNIVEYLANQYESLIINSDKKALEQKKVKNKIHLEKPDNLVVVLMKNVDFL
jgi:S-adenosylmethionine:diacylglycerol 3-amino-3-carboxypropyl transferase